MSVGIVILAAGESARMGAPKQLLEFRGATLLQHAIDCARSIRNAPVAVVLGAHAEQIQMHLKGADVLVVENPEWSAGMGGSLRVGLNALLTAHPTLSSVLFLVCDQPLITAAALGNLIAAQERTGHVIVASEYDGILGVPALFGRELFPQLLALGGGEGARQVIAARRDFAIGVPFPDGTVDIDTPVDYARLRSAPDDLPLLTLV
ncbi:MAG: nucleotidyltransferase family protein [Chthoniobacteraceae bacterium]